MGDRSTKAGRVLSFCSSLPGAGATTTAANVASRLAAFGEVLILDCDLTGGGITGLARGCSSASDLLGLGQVLQDGAHLSPGALLDQPERAWSRDGMLGEKPDDAEEIWLIPGCGAPTESPVGRSWNGSSSGPWLVEPREAGRRLDELLALLTDWAYMAEDDRWVLIDVPAHPFVAPLIRDAVSRSTAETSRSTADREAGPLMLACFAWTAEHLIHTQRLVSRLVRADQHSVEILCTRGPAGGMPAAGVDPAGPSYLTAIEQRLQREIAERFHGPVDAKGAARSPGPPVIPFNEDLLSGARVLGASDADGRRAAPGRDGGYGLLTTWLRSLPHR